MDVKVDRCSDEQLKKKDVFSWPVWSKEVSRFDWHYDDIEECYFLEGEVVLETKDGQTIQFGKGDFVTFTKGLSCTWDIKKPVKKHYNFR
ncbi:MAG: cupin domain-containing protein [Candidatus Omnitrophica bacterium]|nr:cupin domain-containing protein [Candidatus Omnitrophota bacterium]